MRTIEEKNLKAAITKFYNWIKENDSFADFFNDCQGLEMKSLQELSFKNDEEFFNGLRNVMSIIATIIHHPHMTNREREIIVRSDQAANLTQDMFNKTMRDSELWSERNLKMVPEYVYYSEHVDELRIYENIFIVHLVDKIQEEMDTYKVATVPNSTSTMHKLASTPITLDCFEIGDYDENLAVDKLNEEGLTEEGKAAGFIPHWHIDEFTTKLINHLEELRQMYLKTKDKKYWKELIRWLPESWVQTRTWTANYETLRNIYHQRKNHKLSEWHTFCKELEKLPYAEELIIN